MNTTRTTPIRLLLGPVLAVVLTLAVLAVPSTPAAAQSSSASCAAITDSVTRLYSAFFLRQPDPSGNAFWVERYMTGQVGLAHMASSFAESSEFQRRYGQLDDEGFVRLVYENVLDRQPDGSGLAFWTGRLGQGWTRGMVMIGFSESSEYVRKTNTATPLSGGFPSGTRFYCGTGNRVVEIGAPSQGAIIRASMGGSGNNVIWTRGPGLERGDLLVNEIGSYRGDHLVNYGRSSRVHAQHLEIESSSGWAIALAPLGFAQPMGNGIDGSGDTVLRVARGPGVVNLQHTGSSNFAIWAYTASRAQLVANEIGSFQGQTVLEQAPGYLQVVADGSWSIHFG